MTTLAEAQKAYVDNADFDTTDDTAKAKAFIVAGRRLLLLQHTEAAKGGGAGFSQKIDVALIKQELEYARQWLDENDADAEAMVIYPDFRDFRNGGITND